MQKLLLENLAINQAFNAALRKNPTIDSITNRLIAQIMFQPDDAVRRTALDSVELSLVDHFARVVQPAARKIGVTNARKILTQIGPGDLNDPAFRQQVLVDLKLRADDRIRIVQAVVNDKANTLDNRLAAYWLEPGANTNQKLQTLRESHATMEANRRVFDRELDRFNAGQIEKKPRKPNLDFQAKFTEDVKEGFRQQARRSGTDAEVATFVGQGHEILAWITVNATDACPDCRLRQGARGDLVFWDRLGRPGSGKTVCGASCFCLLVPEQTLDRNPHLERGLIVNVQPVLATDDDVGWLRDSRK